MVVIPAEAGIQFFDVINKEKSLNLGIRNFQKQIILFTSRIFP
jgi:hypothetical protein